MKNFLVYDDEGVILRSGYCKDSDLSMQAGVGEYVLEGVADDATKMVVDGRIVDKPDTGESELVAVETRLNRDALLRETDWTQTNDSPLSESDQLKYRAYRQALRDLTTHENWPELQEEDWPTLEN